MDPVALDLSVAQAVVHSEVAHLDHLEAAHLDHLVHLEVAHLVHLVHTMEVEQVMKIENFKKTFLKLIFFSTRWLHSANY